MHLLWLMPEPPLPPFSGGRERARRMLDHMAAQQAVHLVTYAAEADAPLLEALRPTLAGLTVLPYPARGQPYGAAQGAVLPGLKPAHGEWDTVHVQGLALWGAGRAVSGCPRLVLDLFDVPSVIEQRLRRLRPRPWDALALRQARQREASALREAQAIIVASAHDAAALRQAHPTLRTPVTVVPNGVDCAYWRALPEPPEPATLLFPGGLNYPPNVDAAQVLVRAVLPRVRAAVPEARVILAGRLPAPPVRALADLPGVTLCADPDDMRPLLARAALVAVPLRAGSGTRLKILQALAAARPVVSTPLGAEGLDLQPGRDLCVAPLVEAFAGEVARLLGDPAARAALAATGPPAAARYDWPQQLPALAAVYP